MSPTVGERDGRVMHAASDLGNGTDPDWRAATLIAERIGHDESMAKDWVHLATLLGIGGGESSTAERVPLAPWYLVRVTPPDVRFARAYRSWHKGAMRPHIHNLFHESRSVTLRRMLSTLSTALAACLLALTASLALPSAAHAQQSAMFLSHINEAGARMCIRPTGPGLYEQQEPVNCFGQYEQFWWIDYAGYGSAPGIQGNTYLYRLRNSSNDLCIDVTNRASSVPEGTLLEMNTCGSQKGNLWAFDAYVPYPGAPFSGYVLHNVGNGKCLQSYGWLGTWLVLHTCDGSYTGQRFFLSTTRP